MSNTKKSVLLYGPEIEKHEGVYGGGAGGYTRKMALYLEGFRDSTFFFKPCFHTVAGHRPFDFMVLRFFIDMFRFMRHVLADRPAVVHILAQYRTAIVREFFVTLLARVFFLPTVYEIKAGVFIEWYRGTNFLNRWMARFCIARAGVVLGQGMPYVDFIRDEMGVEVKYHPNFMLNEEIREVASNKLVGEELRLLFVGYAFRDKGVFEIIEACDKASKTTKIHLTMIGKEHEAFSAMVDRLECSSTFTLTRRGTLEHEAVLEAFESNDIYIYPTYHVGEGHNNSINEAMMHGLAIITTRRGFLGLILNEDTAYFVREQDADHLHETIDRINQNRDEAQNRAHAAREYFLDNFTGDVAFQKLRSYYSSLMQDGH